MIPPLSPIPNVISQSRRILEGVIAIIRPYLSNTLPPAINQRWLQIANKLPVEAEWTGCQLQVDKILSFLFPPPSHLPAIHGTMDFTLRLRHQRNHRLSLNLVMTFHDLTLSNPLPLSIKRADLHCQISLSPRRHTTTGTLTSHLTAISFSLPAPFAGHITLQKIHIRGTLNHQRYTFTAHAEKLAAPLIRWEKHIIKEIRWQTLALTPAGLSVKNLKAVYKTQPLLLSDIRCDFYPLTLTLAGSFPLHIPRLPISSPLPLHGISGNAAFTLRGNLQSHDPTLVSTIRIDPLHTHVGTIPLPPLHVFAKAAYKNARLTLAPLTLALDPDLSLQGTLRLPLCPHPLKNFQGRLNLRIPQLEKISRLLGKIFPGTLSDFQAAGNLELASRFRLTHTHLIVRGNVSLTGTFQNMVLPITLRHTRLNLPFALGFSLHGEQTRETNLQVPHPAVSPGSLKISQIGFGPLRFRNLNGRLYVQNSSLRIANISGSLFQGNMKGRGRFNFLPPFPWNLNLRLERISLHDICHQIPGMEDALSGKVMAHLTLSGNGSKLDSMHGIFNASTMETRDEPMRISQAFIRKLTGKKGRFLFYGTYRPYSTGRMKAEIRHGIVIFKTLELSHAFLGFHDLSVSVSPLSNRIGLHDLIWEILQVPGTSNRSPVIKTK